MDLLNRCQSAHGFHSLCCPILLHIFPMRRLHKIEATKKEDKKIEESVIHIHLVVVHSPWQSIL